MSLLHLFQSTSPFLRNLLPAIGTSYGLQALVALPSILLQSERFYDVSGSLTYLSCVTLSLLLPTARTHIWSSPEFNWRQLALSAAVMTWATRLGAYLFRRINMENGQDSRFTKIRGNPVRFASAFFAQATWVTLCSLPVLAVNSLPASAFPNDPSITITDIIGFSVYLFGIGFECLADYQKSVWSHEKRQKRHEEEFITRGLWGTSRHPNYFGEITLWTGIAIASAGVLCSDAAVTSLGLESKVLGRLAMFSMAAVSPSFVTLLLFKVSGIPLTEKKYDKKYAGNKSYQQWKKNTPLFFPKLF
ncbi:hypothetical protein PROFUN_04128 [Planoprotostelium fungivorum]|uniref:Uncharacterized protein n=1 Tax=Planoprotostelium fungivorum TaxID=1890364 RepID=A0A2P6N217_9EUKA|nr:hypothetical protein PROFUN_14090 [Planoprotostelium fungivorum]PRP84137.1 hypothetical protein PROFUN_04128 [Planoprotostelium fungivorum]